MEDAYEKMINYFPKFPKPEFEEPTDQWIKDFKYRNSFKSTKGSDLEKERAKNATVGNMKWWWENVFKKIEIDKYNSKFIFNGDETMLQSCGKFTVLIRKWEETGVIVEDENADHITMMNTISVNGDSMLPLFIFQLKTFPAILQQMVNDGKLIVMGNKEGWMDDKIFLEWTKKFIEWVNQRRISFKMPDERALLFIDSHWSRENPEALQLLKDAKVDVYTYPGDCSHILQALDVGIFGPFKTYLKKQKRKIKLTNFKFTNENTPSLASLRRAKVVLASINALTQACTYTNIKSAWTRTGLYPPNLDVILTNPRLNSNTEVTIDIPPETVGKRFSITSKCITSSEVIEQIKKNKDEKARKASISPK